jgi:hypothetical protein
VKRPVCSICIHTYIYRPMGVCVCVYIYIYIIPPPQALRKATSELLSSCYHCVTLVFVKISNLEVGYRSTVKLKCRVVPRGGGCKINFLRSLVRLITSVVVILMSRNYRCRIWCIKVGEKRHTVYS